jgi:hypothetical protein
MLLSVGSQFRSGILPCIGQVLACWFYINSVPNLTLLAFSRIILPGVVGVNVERDIEKLMGRGGGVGKKEELVGNSVGSGLNIKTKRARNMSLTR